ncbi:DUF881 domain-containing protein [Kineococcus rhizosphaerae]|uniref:Uncharacterized protein YlxW (UPF0749 family) n=1 Tax=Kineococcus rhizosphaerae TaxID=559628 RepID=A0A2T0QYH8_9ACTN|nr:DUF881 domain-containing protein [Kineococcus rhizosphaerae]PRY11406.1 uncharacterized protein YlxW (UPF0749 family) [Kineococcus rhizosphaerae]
MRVTGGRVVRRAGVVLVLAAAGLLFATSALTSGGTDLRSESADLGSVVAQRSRDNAAEAARVAVLRSEVDALSRGGTTTGQGEDPLDDPALGAASGALAVHGPGLSVTLDDAPDSVRPASASPDDLVVHQQDVESVVNALWAGGAEAMMIMDQRIVSTSAVRCVGNVLVLQGRTYSPPYTISAIGDVTRLRQALADSAQIAVYRQYVAAYGLGYRVDAATDLRLPAFDGTTTLTYARAGAA